MKSAKVTRPAPAPASSGEPWRLEDLSPEERADIEAGVAEADRGELVDWADIRDDMYRLAAELAAKRSR
jgi:hypothetical protein